jgi:hypothetical protein
LFEKEQASTAIKANSFKYSPGTARRKENYDSKKLVA